MERPDLSVEQGGSQEEPIEEDPNAPYTVEQFYAVMQEVVKKLPRELDFVGIICPKDQENVGLIGPTKSPKDFLGIMDLGRMAFIHRQFVMSMPTHEKPALVKAPANILGKDGRLKVD